MPDLFRDLNSDLVTECLRCPVCKEPLTVSETGRSLVCQGARTHCHDAGAGGYVPLAPRHPGGGDSKEAVRARTGFLRAGYYEKAADALCDIAAEYLPRPARLLDAGCGEGYYTNRLAAAVGTAIGVDLSKYAVDAAARAARAARFLKNETLPARTVYAVGSIFDLPVRDGCMDGVTNVFAPCAPSEFARVLKPGGILIVAGAGATHLMGLKQLLYDDPWHNDPRRDLPGETDAFTLADVRTVTYDVTVLGREAIDALFSMTPYYWRTSPDGRARLAETETLETPVSFEFHIYRKTK